MSYVWRLVVAVGHLKSFACSEGDIVSDMEWDHFNLVNQLRADGFSCPAGVTFAPNSEPLIFECRLYKASYLHSKDMGELKYFSHTSKDGRSPWDRAGAVGAMASGENIAAGISSAQAALNGWKGSDGHCRNMGNPSFKYFAVGNALVAGSPYGHYWTQMFGRDVPEDGVSTSCYGGREPGSGSGGSQKGKFHAALWVHIASMAIAWNLLFPWGAIMARYSREMKPNSAWYDIHRFLQSLGWCMQLAGFIAGVCYVAQVIDVESTAFSSCKYEFSHFGSFHAIGGLVLTIVVTFQPAVVFIPRVVKHAKVQSVAKNTHKAFGWMAIGLGCINAWIGVAFLCLQCLAAGIIVAASFLVFALQLPAIVFAPLMCRRREIALRCLQRLVDVWSIAVRKCKYCFGKCEPCCLLFRNFCVRYFALCARCCRRSPETQSWSDLEKGKYNVEKKRKSNVEKKGKSNAEKKTWKGKSGVEKKSKSIVSKKNKTNSEKRGFIWARTLPDTE